jgi:anti-sigma factor RsiW
MTNMEDMDILLAAYADGELDEATARDVEAYLAANPAAQRTLAMHRETTALLRTAFSESHFADGPAAVPPRFRPGALLSRYGLAIAACLLMGMIGYTTAAFWPGLVVPERTRIFTEIAEDHAVYSRETVHLVEVPANQTDHLKAWLGKRVNRTLIIPDFRAAGLTFAGGRLVVLDGAPVAELMYTRENGLPIAFCILSSEGKPGKIQAERRGGIYLSGWDDGSHSYVVVGEADSNTIRDLAVRARRQL